MQSCAVCEDDQSAAEVLQGMLNEYPVALDCAVFFDPTILLNAINRGQRFDLYILDIVMPSMTGIDLAREIRKADSECIIIFLTSSEEFHRDAYQLEALQYLYKPVNKKILYHTLDRALSYIGKREDEKLVIQTKTGIHVLDIGQIVYVESFRHVLTFYLCDGSELTTLDSTLSLEKLSESIPFPPFCAPYRGFIVNMSYVECLGKLQFCMPGGATIPIPQKQFSKVRQLYSDYLLTRNTKGDHGCTGIF